MTKLPAAPDTKFEFLNVRGAAPLNRHQRVWAPKYKTIPSHGTGLGGGGNVLGLPCKNTERLCVISVSSLGHPVITFPYLQHSKYINSGATKSLFD